MTTRPIKNIHVILPKLLFFSAFDFYLTQLTFWLLFGLKLGLLS